MRAVSDGISPASLRIPPPLALESPQRGTNLWIASVGMQTSHMRVGCDAPEGLPATARSL